MERNRIEFFNIVFPYLYEGLLPIDDFGSCCGCSGNNYYIEFTDPLLNLLQFDSLLYKLSKFNIRLTSIKGCNENGVVLTVFFKDLSYGKK